VTDFERSLMMIGTMLNELHKEAATTKRILERVPGDKLAWTPHPKSTRSSVSRRSYSVAGKWYFFVAFAPRVFSISA
jgi:hypothetical protein